MSFKMKKKVSCLAFHLKHPLVAALVLVRIEKSHYHSPSSHPKLSVDLDPHPGTKKKSETRDEKYFSGLLYFFHPLRADPIRLVSCLLHVLLPLDFQSKLLHLYERVTCPGTKMIHELMLES